MSARGGGLRRLLSLNPSHVPLWAWLSLGLLGLGLVAAWRFRQLLVIFAAGALLAYVLAPAARTLQRIRLPRVVGGILIHLGLLAGLGFLAWGLGGLLVVQVRELARLVGRLAPLLPLAQESSAWPATLISMGGPRLADALQLLLAGLLAVAVSFSLVTQPPTHGSLVGWLPSSERGIGRALVGEIDRRLRSYLLRLGASATLAALGTLGVVAGLGLPSPLVMGVIAGLAEAIPVLGPLLGMVLPVLAALLLAPARAPLVLLGLLLVQILKRLVLDRWGPPRAVRLNPLLLLLLLLVTPRLLGWPALVIAVPAAATAQAMADCLWGCYMGPGGSQAWMARLGQQRHPTPHPELAGEVGRHAA